MPRLCNCISKANPKTMMPTDCTIKLYWEGKFAGHYALNMDSERAKRINRQVQGKEDASPMVVGKIEDRQKAYDFLIKHKLTFTEIEINH